MEASTFERLTPERRRELTRQALLEAAALVFARRGFHAASLDEVAEAAGFSKGAIYSNFASKEDLFFAVVEHRDRTRLAELAALLAGELGGDIGPLLSRVAEVLAAHLYGDRDGMLLETEVWLYAQRNPGARRRLAAHQRDHLKGVSRYVVEVAATAGIELRVPADELAALMLAATSGIAQLRLADPEAGHERLLGRLLLLLTDAAIEPARQRRGRPGQKPGRAAVTRSRQRE